MSSAGERTGLSRGPISRPLAPDGGRNIWSKISRREGTVGPYQLRCHLLPRQSCLASTDFDAGSSREGVEWVGDHTAEWFRSRVPTSTAVVNEMKDAGVLIFAGGRMWAGKIAVGCGWPQEVRRFGPQPPGTRHVEWDTPRA